MVANIFGELMKIHPRDENNLNLLICHYIIKVYPKKKAA